MSQVVMNGRGEREHARRFSLTTVATLPRGARTETHNACWAESPTDETTHTKVNCNLSRAKIIIMIPMTSRAGCHSGSLRGQSGRDKHEDGHF